MVFFSFCIIIPLLQTSIYCFDYIMDMPLIQFVFAELGEMRLKAPALGGTFGVFWLNYIRKNVIIKQLNGC